MIEDISDNRLLFYLRQLIDKSSPTIKHLLKSTRYCGSKVIKQMGLEEGVFLVKNNKNARFAGLATCKNSWLCPVCSARVMSKYAAEIASAIEALKSASKPQLAFMVTFSIPHTSGMSAYETTEILYNSWKNFIVRGNKNLTSSWNSNAEEDRYKRGATKIRKFGNKGKDPFASFCEEFNCIHRVRVGEYTWGNHGWHPHFHCLFWVDADKFEMLKRAEAALNARWLQLVKRNTLKMWDRLYPNNKKNNAIRLECMYKNLNEGSQACYFSKDENGEIIIQKSSSYICGWGADKELTGNVQNKATAEGHFTPRQLLEKYADGDEKAGQLYIEYCLAVKGKHHHTRINFTKGLKQIIEKYRQTEQYMTVLKKKAIDDANANGTWKQVCWFKSQQWRDICFAEETTKKPIRYLLLKMAMEINGYKLIADFLLETLNIDIRNNGQHSRVDIYADTFKFVAA